MSEEIQHEHTHVFKCPVTGAEAKLTQLPSGNFKIDLNSAEMQPEFFEAVGNAIKNMYNNT